VLPVAWAGGGDFAQDDFHPVIVRFVVHGKLVAEAQPLSNLMPKWQKENN